MKHMYSIFTIVFLIIGCGYFFFKGSLFYHYPSPHIMQFDESMALSSFSHLLDRRDIRYVYQVCKNLYNTNRWDKFSQESTLRIPKIIHIMWLGGKVPQEYEPYIASWRKYHPEWTLLFWTDSALNYDKGDKVVSTFEELSECLLSTKNGAHIVIDTKGLRFDNRQFYDEAINYGEKSDILKWEIVYRFGGLYVDTDFECLRPLDFYHYTYDFYTGLQPLDTNMVQLGAALYGAIPRHPIMKACVERIKDNQHIKQIVVKTGPIHFTKIFTHLAGKTGFRDIALPASYLYPCGYEQRGHPKQEWCKSESYAVHHWAGSWLKPEAFVKA